MTTGGRRVHFQCHNTSQGPAFRILLEGTVHPKMQTTYFYSYRKCNFAFCLYVRCWVLMGCLPSLTCNEPGWLWVCCTQSAIKMLLKNSRSMCLSRNPDPVKTRGSWLWQDRPGQWPNALKSDAIGSPLASLVNVTWLTELQLVILTLSIFPYPNQVGFVLLNNQTVTIWQN